MRAYLAKLAQNVERVDCDFVRQSIYALPIANPKQIGFIPPMRREAGFPPPISLHSGWNGFQNKARLFLTGLAQ
jgi:hypothetical protein